MKVVWGANEQKDSCSYLLLRPNPPRTRGAIRQGTHEAGGQSSNARGIPPQSLHIDLGKGSHAIDYVPLARIPISGEFVASWDDDTTYGITRKIAEKHGLRGLDWEQPHLEDANISGWRELVSPQKQVVNNKKISLVNKRPWSSR